MSVGDLKRKKKGGEGDVSVRQKDRTRVGSFARASVQCPQVEEAERWKNGTQKGNCKVFKRALEKDALKKGVVLGESSSAIIYMNSRYLDSREENQKAATRGAVARHVTCEKAN